MTSAAMVALLVAGGVYLVLQRGLVRLVLGFVMLGHAANLVLLAAGGTSRRGAALLGTTDPADAADPLPQAFALTAIVITFGITVYLLALASGGGDEEPDKSDAPHGVGGAGGSAGPGRVVGPLADGGRDV